MSSAVGSSRRLRLAAAEFSSAVRAAAAAYTTSLSLTHISLASPTNNLPTQSIQFMNRLVLSCVSTLTRDIDIAILSIRPLCSNIR